MISNVKVYGLDDSIKASKYPMSVDTDKCNADITPRTKSLATCDTGTGHDQFLTGIVVQFDLTFTVKAWTEAETTITETEAPAATSVAMFSWPRQMRPI